MRALLKDTLLCCITTGYALLLAWASSPQPSRPHVTCQTARESHPAPYICVYLYISASSGFDDPVHHEQYLRDGNRYATVLLYLSGGRVPCMVLPALPACTTRGAPNLTLEQATHSHAALHHVLNALNTCGMVVRVHAEVEGGGETALPLADAIDWEKQSTEGMSACANRMGIAVVPRKGGSCVWV